MASLRSVPYLDKDQRPIRRLHDQIYFATAPPRGPIIALHNLQALCLQIAQSAAFSRIPFLLGG